MKLRFEVREFPLANPFVISRGSKTHASVVEVSIEQSGLIGLGEGVPYSRYGETSDSVSKQLASLPEEFTRQQLQELLPPGAARNAVDCALWDLEAKLSGLSVWELAELPKPMPLDMGETISLGPVHQMLARAKELENAKLIKLKLGSPNDEEVLLRIREFAPAPRLLVDVNEGWSKEQFEQLVPALEAARVEILEQPLRDQDSQHLRDIKLNAVLCADESLHPSQGLEHLADRYQMVNIKLDKSGGLTTAIEQVKQARELGLGVMIGCMVSSSLSIAPGYLLGQLADLVDLDGFSLLAHDRPGGFEIYSGQLRPTDESFWG